MVCHFLSKRRFLPVYFLVVLVLVPFRIAADGPLRGKLLDVPHQIYYAFPGFSASDGLDRSVRARGQLYYINEFRGYSFDPEDESLDNDGKLSDSQRARDLTAMDFEALVMDSTISFPVGRSPSSGNYPSLL